MKKNFINSERIEGRLYQHKLELKVTGPTSKAPGTEFISGTVDIATDEEGLNVIPIHYTYVTEMTSGGKKNATFATLKSIIDGAKTWIADGKDVALKVRANTALGLNDFYNQENQLVSVKRNEGGFLNIVKDLAKEEERNTFDVDIVINAVTPKEADPENGIESDYVIIRGAVFDFRKALLPVEFVCRDAAGMSYFESLDASNNNPVFTRVKGNIVSNTITREIKEESAFGAASVKTVSRTVKEWVVNWANLVEYDFGAEDTITGAELKEAMQNRQVYLAEQKKQRDDYLASRAAATTATAKTNTVPAGNFDF